MRKTYRTRVGLKARDTNGVLLPMGDEVPLFFYLNFFFLPVFGVETRGKIICISRGRRKLFFFL